MNYYRKIAGLLRANTGSVRLAVVFDDFVEMAALAFRNAVDQAGRDERETQYLTTAGRYSRQQLDRFAHALALVVLAMEQEPGDVLGRLYMELEICEPDRGNCYTDNSAAALLAELVLVPTAETLSRQSHPLHPGPQRKPVPNHPRGERRQ